jgi:hypothetical protein
MSFIYSQTQRDPFKFHLQEEKMSLLRAKTQMAVQRDLYETKENISEKQLVVENHYGTHDFNNDFIKTLTDRYKKEIDLLKTYINKINGEIRKRLNIEIPLLSEESATKAEDMNEFLVLLNDAFMRLQNPEYINPLFKLYEDLIGNLEGELKQYKQLCTRYEGKISDLTKENGSLRENLMVKTNELKDLLRVRVDGKMIYDEDYIKQVDVRNDLLSRENEILLLNYQHLAKEFGNFQNLYSDKHKENLDKIALYDTISEELHRVNTVLDNAIYRAQVNETKTIELSEIVSRLELERSNLSTQVEHFRSENKSLAEAVDFYKNYINKLNNL